MIKKNLVTAACVAALCLGGVAQAAIVTFDDPGLVEIDNNTNLATYIEAGFKITGQAASFLPIAMRLVGGFDATSFSLMQVGGGNFSLLSLDYDFFDLGFGDQNSTLTITGLLGGSTVASRTVNLAGPNGLMFGADWSRVSEVSFTGSAGFSLDNINAAAAMLVPAPGTMALSCLALAALGLRRVRGRRST